MLKTYYMLTKPGIIMGNLITTAGGFALASKGQLDVILFLKTLIGLGLVIASACIFNNYIDRHADEKMARTKNRGFVKQTISVSKALILAIVMGILGILILGFFVNMISMFAAIVGFIIYVVVYSFLKYHWTAGTIIGSIAGAIPPVVGYLAVSSRFDSGALILFLIVALWQMPHFFSIALYSLDDYRAASIPVLPVKKGIRLTKIYMLFYILAFIAAEVLLLALGYAGYLYLAVASTLSFYWLILCIRGFRAKNEVRWAKQMFQVSLVVITAVSFLISFDPL